MLAGSLVALAWVLIALMGAMGGFLFVLTIRGA